MLRITAEETPNLTRLRLEGKLKGAWVAELEAVYLERKKSSTNSQLVLDIRSLTGTDQAGKYLIALLQREGATLDFSGPWPAHLLAIGTQGEDCGNAAIPVSRERFQ